MRWAQGNPEDKLDVEPMSIGEFMTFLFPYFWPDGWLNRFRALGCFLLLAVSKACILSSPLFLGFAVDEVSRGIFPWESILYFVLLRMGGPAFNELQRYVYLEVIKVAYVATAEQTFRHVQYLSYSFHLDKKSGALQRSLERGLTAGGNVVQWLFLRLGPTVIELIVLCVIAATTLNSPWSALVLFIGFSVYIAITFAVNEWRRRLQRRMIKKDNNAWRIAADSLANFEIVKSFAREEFEVARYTEAATAYQERKYDMAASLSVINVTQQVVQQLTLLGTMLLSARDVVEGRMSVGAWTALFAFVVQAFAPLSFLGTMYSIIVGAFSDIEALLGLLRENPEVEDAPNAPPLQLEGAARVAVYGEDKAAGGSGGGGSGGGGSGGEGEGRVVGSLVRGGDGASGSGIGVEVRFEGVYFAYPMRRGTTKEERIGARPGQKDGEGRDNMGGAGEEGEGVGKASGPEDGESDDVQYVLRNVSFVVPANKTMAIVGATGSGKSTLGRLLFRFFDPQRGRILVAGQDIRSVQQRTVRLAVGMVPQDTTLFNDSLEANISYGKLQATEQEVRAAAADAELDDFVQTLKKKYDTVVGERGLKLSGGERQRVAIARAILKDPPVLVLDEATAALDSITEAKVQAALDRASGGRTVIVIAHRLSTIRRADQILVLDRGVVQEIGSFDELMEKDGAFAAYWRAQEEREREMEMGGTAEEEVKLEES